MNDTTENWPIFYNKMVQSAIEPSYSTNQAAGLDFYFCPEVQGEPTVTIMPHASHIIHTGIRLELPIGTVGFLCARSGISNLYGIAPADKVGVIDSDYRGEITAHLYNHSDSPYEIHASDRVFQLVVAPVLHSIISEVSQLAESERGTRGYGSTGK